MRGETSLTFSSGEAEDEIYMKLEVVVGVDDGSPPVALTQSSFCKLATGFGATLHCQARSLKKCIQAVSYTHLTLPTKA